MKALKKNGRGGGMAAALLVVAVLGLFSLTGCVSAPYMPNPVDVAAGSEEDPFAGTRWEYVVEGGGIVKTTNVLLFHKDGTASLNGSKPKQYTVTSGDDGKYMAKFDGGLNYNAVAFIIIDKPDATEGISQVVYKMGGTMQFSATKK